MKTKYMDEIRRAVTARDAAERMGMTISRNGSEYVTLCPWHNDTNPSLTLYDDNGIGRCKCFACGNGGSSIDLVAQTERCSTTEACRKLADWFHLNVEIPEGKPGKRREKVEHPLAAQRELRARRAPAGQRQVVRHGKRPEHVPLIPQVGDIRK